MRILQSTILSAGLLLAFSSVAAADGDWQTVSLGNIPDFTIEIPASVGDDYLPDAENEDGVLNFALANDPHSILACSMSRTAYTEDFSRSDAKTNLGQQSRLCNAGDGATNVSIEHVGPTSIGGAPAAECEMNYTAATSDNPGQTHSALYIAAPDAVYILSCTLYADTQGAADAAWRASGAKKVAHIQQSLHLPASK